MESFEQLAEQYGPMIHKIIYSLHIYKNREEFYQHGLIALWEASRRFDPTKGHFSTYVYPYIRGFILMELSNANKEEGRIVYPIVEFWETVEDLYSESPLEKEILLSYCPSLSPNQRKWVLFTVLGGLSVKEIAEREKVSISAVKSWRSGAREKLKVLVER